MNNGFNNGENNNFNNDFNNANGNMNGNNNFNNNFNNVNDNMNGNNNFNNNNISGNPNFNNNFSHYNNSLNTNNNVNQGEDKVFYYGNNDYVERIKNRNYRKQKKSFHVSLISFVVLAISIFGLVKVFDFNYIAIGASVFAFLVSVFNLNSRNIIFILSSLVSLSAIVICALFYFNVVDNTSEALIQLRKDQYVSRVRRVVTYVEKDYLINSYQNKECYNLNRINELFTKKVVKSPFNSLYSSSSYVVIDGPSGNRSYDICFVDENGNGFNNIIDKEQLARKRVRLGNASKCVMPPECK